MTEVTDQPGVLPRLIAQYADTAGCGYYRILDPASALSRSGVAIVDAARNWRDAFDEANPPDALVVQVAPTPQQLPQLSAIRSTYGLTLVQELDDLTLALSATERAALKLPPDTVEAILGFTCVADRMVVATPALAEAFRPYHDDIRVVPNRIDPARWRDLASTVHQGGKPRVGWAGGSSHDRDLLMMAPVVAALAEEVDWVFMGSCPVPMLPQVQEFHHGVPYPQYPAKLARLGLDLAIAPLEITAFNEAKSNLKLLEYGALGYPVLCTDVEPYRGNLPVTRVPNQPEQWIAWIRALLADRAALKASGDALKAAIWRDWTLDTGLDDWKAAWLP